MSGDFHSMRRGLIARGLLSADLRLTEAGNACVDALLGDLADAEAKNDSAGPRVRWNFKGRGLCPVEASHA